MSLTVTLPSELETKIQQATARFGGNVESYVINAVELALKKPSLDELLAPIRRQFAKTGMTEQELTALVKEERRAIWREKHGEE